MKPLNHQNHAQDEQEEKWRGCSSCWWMGLLEPNRGWLRWRCGVTWSGGLGGDRNSRCSWERDGCQWWAVSPSTPPSLSRNRHTTLILLLRNHFTLSLCDIAFAWFSYFSVFLSPFRLGSFPFHDLNAGKPEALNSHYITLSLTLPSWRAHPYPWHPHLCWKECPSFLRTCPSTS